MVAKEFNLKSVFITGGVGGIGFAIAERFARDGACIALVDAKASDDGACERLLAQGASQASFTRCDIANETDARNALRAAATSHGGLHVLINAAGIMTFYPLDELDARTWRRVLDVNLVAPAVLSAEAFSLMQSAKTQGGVIINIASVHAIRTSPLTAPYAAAKAALLSLTRSIAIEGKAKGIRANAILPGAIETSMLRQNPNILAGAEVITQEDIGSPVDIANLAYFLSSSEASFISGDAVVADGGRMARL